VILSYTDIFLNVRTCPPCSLRFPAGPVEPDAAGIDHPHTEAFNTGVQLFRMENKSYKNGEMSVMISGKKTERKIRPGYGLEMHRLCWQLRGKISLIKNQGEGNNLKTNRL